ncbi:LytR C-terminal domain-containing protein [Streptobacillus felis]|uniref:LytR C-terminal domain-containing protein n=1 Tax=Streptobacillus felis TaxID=1384509 RepID=A0A7Z0PGB3_9FUSO|nr:LytR C-terminal domain-containing protein [Streptobacillus felis]NYV27550.1 LytR C-terminal domain-containing protein [Streptobacillus felis]
MKKNLTIFLILLALVSCGTKTMKEIEGNKIVKVENTYYLHYNDTVIKLNEDTYITKDKKVSDYFKGSFFSNEEDDFLVDLKKYFPHGFNGIVEGEAPTNFSQMPLLSLGEKKIIDAIALSKDLSSKNPELLIAKDETKDEEEKKEDNKTEAKEVNLTGKKIAILNANGIDGYARRLGESLKATLGLDAMSENYGKGENLSYIINHKLTQEELEKLVNTVNIKYIKVQNNPDLKSDQDVVLITGNDANVKYSIEVLSKGGLKDVENLLSGYSVTTKTEAKYNNEDIKDETIIIYNPEDIFIAKKLLGLLPNATLKEDTTVNGKLIITTK